MPLCPAALSGCTAREARGGRPDAALFFDDQI